MHSALRSASLAVTGALALSGALAGCSALLDWKGYAGGQAADGEGGSDAGDAGDASSTDVVMPVCGPGNCGGCCNPAGYCAGGLSKSTCGTGGHACTDCAPAGKVCSAGGACVVAVVDAAPPPPCSPMACPFVCAPVYQTNCCKSDGTCGCQVQIPELGPCM